MVAEGDLTEEQEVGGSSQQAASENMDRKTCFGPSADCQWHSLDYRTGEEWLDIRTLWQSSHHLKVDSTVERRKIGIWEQI